MRKLQIAAIAFFAFGSAAYAMGGGPHHPTAAQPDAHSAATAQPMSGAAPYSDYSAYLGTSSQNRPGWGPGEAWGSFPGSLNANGG